MPTTINNEFVINAVESKAVYNSMKSSGQINSNELYFVADDYDLVLEIFTNTTTGSYSERTYSWQIISGSLSNLKNIIDNTSVRKEPRVLVCVKDWYSGYMIKQNIAVSPIILEGSSGQYDVSILVQHFFPSYIYLVQLHTSTSSTTGTVNVLKTGYVR